MCPRARKPFSQNAQLDLHHYDVPEPMYYFCSTCCKVHSISSKVGEKHYEKQAFDSGWVAGTANLVANWVELATDDVESGDSQHATMLLMRAIGSLHKMEAKFVEMADAAYFSGNPS